MRSKVSAFAACALGAGLTTAWMWRPAPVNPENVRGETKPQHARMTSDRADEPVSTTNSVAQNGSASPLQPTSSTSASVSSAAAQPDDLDQARAWARQHPDEALAWLTQAPVSMTRDAVLEIVCAQVAQSDPAQAVALAESTCPECSYLLQNLVQQWADRDEAAAMAYASSRPPGLERDRLLGRVAMMRARHDPADAATLAVEQIAPGVIQDEAVISVLHQWTLRDPLAALAWVETFPAGTLRDRALHELEGAASQWPAQKR